MPASHPSHSGPTLPGQADDSTPPLSQREEERALFRLLAHDLRNPIGSAKMGADAIVRGRDVPEAIVAKARRASLALGRADSLLSRFADLRLLHDGEPLPLERDATDWRAVVLAAAERSHSALGPRLRVEVEAVGAVVGQWDGRYIGRALDELLDNAARHGRPGAPIVLRASAADAGVRAAVASEGDGLTFAEQRALLATTPWQRLKSGPRGQPGWGFGLLLARTVATQHGGSLELASENGTTCFTLHLPCS